jgi:hypothetical protein
MEPLRGSNGIPDGVIILLMEPLRGSNGIPDGVII